MLTVFAARAPAWRGGCRVNSDWRRRRAEGEEAASCDGGRACWGEGAVPSGHAMFASSGPLACPPGARLPEHRNNPPVLRRPAGLPAGWLRFARHDARDRCAGIAKDLAGQNRFRHPGKLEARKLSHSFCSHLQNGFVSPNRSCEGCLARRGNPALFFKLPPAPGKPLYATSMLLCVAFPCAATATT